SRPPAVRAASSTRKRVWQAGQVRIMLRQPGSARPPSDNGGSNRNHPGFGLACRSAPNRFLGAPRKVTVNPRHTLRQQTLEALRKRYIWPSITVKRATRGVPGKLAGCTGYDRGVPQDDCKDSGSLGPITSNTRCFPVEELNSADFDQCSVNVTVG